MANFDRLLAAYIRSVIESASASDALSETVSVARNYRPKREAKDIDGPIVTVAHGLQSRESSSRIHQKRTHRIAIVLQAKIEQIDGQVDDERCDELSDLTESLLDLISTGADSYDSASLESITTDPFYDPEAMDNPGIWQGILIATYSRNARQY